MPVDTCHHLRSALLDLHRTLVDLERRDYEKRNGPQGAGDFLQVMAYSDDMRWLDPLSRLIVMLDEAIDGKGDADLTPLAVAQRTRELLALNRESQEAFMARYVGHFDGSPELVEAHARALSALKAVGTQAPAA
ncbi:hypothetical protein SAMN05216359_108132 [Roseateles sp. YR242]|uniref:hypothetical protein n=1 Tax=Roseateles sp. YR242 TaxID=1855305 RepID=UPI0008BD445C|nr:hypothetical protein [Roseateles sp. YR242]SEL38800.1 hypothetical protein SAMN05216359_108132 [Roseateles sp. YR242]